MWFKNHFFQDSEASAKAPMLSLAAHHTLRDLLYPFRTFSSPLNLTPTSLSAITDHSPTSLSTTNSLPCDIELVDMAMLPNYKEAMNDASYLPTVEASITIRRLGFDGRFLSKNGIQMPNSCSIEENRLGKVWQIKFTTYKIKIII